MDKTRVLGASVGVDSEAQGELQLDYSNDDRMAAFN